MFYVSVSVITLNKFTVPIARVILKDNEPSKQIQVQSQE